MTVELLANQKFESFVPRGSKNGVEVAILRPSEKTQGKIIGVESFQLVYFTDRHYNPADEFRTAYNCPAIAYDWEVQRK